MKKVTFIVFILLVTMLLSSMGGLTGINAIQVQKSALDCPENDGLPVIYIQTDDNKGITSKTDYKSAKMTIALNEEFSKCTNYYTENVGAIKIRGRGNSTWTGNSVKHSYRIKLDKKSDMFGFGSSKHWILLANYYEPTFLRNKMAYDFSNAIGMWSPESTWVVLYFNGSYAGLYQLCESIRVSKERVNITNWENIAEDIAAAITKKENLSDLQHEVMEKAMVENLSWITTGKYDKYTISDYYDTSTFDTTSGYLIEYDAFMDSISQWYTNKGSPCMVDTPEYLKTNSTLFNYVKNLVQDFEDACRSSSFYNSKGKHWSEYVDVDDLVDYWMVQTVLSNGEFGIRSGFFYIEKGKIHFGPNWDFDCGGGNHFTVTTRYDNWNGTGDRNYFYQGLYKDPYFQSLCQQRWIEIRDIVNQMPDYLKGLGTYVAAAAERDIVKFPNPRMWWSTPKYTSSRKQEYDDYYNWLVNRIAWLDGQLTAEHPTIGGVNVVSEKITMSIQDSNKKTLKTDPTRPNEINVSYGYDPATSDYITVKASTTHTTLVSYDIYLNGKTIAKAQKADNKTPLSYNIPNSLLKTGEGDINVIVLIANNSSGPYRYSYRYLRCTGRSLSSGEVVIVFDDGMKDNVNIIAKNSELTVPKIEVERPGFTALGWVRSRDGTETLYKEGATVPTTSSSEYRIKWKRNHIFNVMFEDEIKVKNEVPPVVPKPDYEKAKAAVPERKTKLVGIVASIISAILVIGGTASSVVNKTGSDKMNIKE